MKRTVLGKDIFWWLWRTLFRVKADSWLGRRLRSKPLGGGVALLDIDEDGSKSVAREVWRCRPATTV